MKKQGNDMNKDRRNVVAIGLDAHRRLRSFADEHGLKIGALAENIINGWLDGRPFFVPEALPCRKESDGAGRAVTESVSPLRGGGVDVGEEGAR